MAVIPMAFSPATIARDFQIVDEFEINGLPLAIVYNEKAPRAAIIEQDLHVDKNGDPRHRVIATLDLQRKTTIGDNVIAVRRFWEDTETVAQIEGVCVDAQLQGVGLATRLYEKLILERGLILISDNEQYEGGKALWRRIARTSEELAVFVLDTDKGVFYPYDGDRVQYDGESIPEEKIWSRHPDKSLHGVVLVAESAARIAQAA